MATLVGGSSDLAKLIRDFILLEHDAIAAYDTVIERLESASLSNQVAEFRADHQRHLSELRELAREHGAEAPEQGDAKAMLTTGKIKLADMVGADGNILNAMSTNETDMITAYQRGVDNPAVPEPARPIFARALEDEKRHKAWMVDAAGAA